MTEIITFVERSILLHVASNKAILNFLKGSLDYFPLLRHGVMKMNLTDFDFSISIKTCSVLHTNKEFRAQFQTDSLFLSSTENLSTACSDDIKNTESYY